MSIKHYFVLTLSVLLAQATLHAQEQSAKTEDKPAQTSTSSSATEDKPAQTSTSSTSGESESASSLDLTPSDGEIKKADYLFIDKDLLGVGGSVFVGDAIRIAPDVFHNGYYGGNFYFGFKDYLRLGIQGALLEALVATDDTVSPQLNGFYVGALAAVVEHLGPVEFTQGVVFGYGTLMAQPSFVINPEVSIGLRMTKEFAFFVKGGWMMFLNGTSLSQDNTFKEAMFPNISLQISFGAV